MTRYLVILDIRHNGSSYGTTRDLIDADDAAQAERKAIEAWQQANGHRTYHDS